MFTPKFFSTTAGIAADSLAHLFILSNAFTERPAANNLLLRWGILLKIETGFAAQLPDRSLEHDIKVFTNNPSALF
ncbi:hypothetical protein D3C71_1933550 [compost metagenome]